MEKAGSRLPMGSKVGSVNTGLQDQALTTAHKPSCTNESGQRKLVLFCYTQLGKNMNLTCSQGMDMPLGLWL